MKIITKIQQIKINQERKHKENEEMQDVAIAWLCSQVTPTQIERFYKRKIGLHYLAIHLRDAYRKGKILIK